MNYHGDDYPLMRERDLAKRLLARGIQVPDFQDPNSLASCLDTLQRLTKAVSDAGRRRFEKLAGPHGHGSGGMAPRARTTDIKDMRLHLRHYEKECDKVRTKLDSLEASIAPRVKYWEGVRGEAADPTVLLKRIKRKAEAALEERQAVAEGAKRKLPPFTDDPEQEVVRYLNRRGFGGP